MNNNRPSIFAAGWSQHDMEPRVVSSSDTRWSYSHFHTSQDTFKSFNQNMIKIEWLCLEVGHRTTHLLFINLCLTMTSVTSKRQQLHPAVSIWWMNVCDLQEVTDPCLGNPHYRTNRQWHYRADLHPHHSNRFIHWVNCNLHHTWEAPSTCSWFICAVTWLCFIH